jgi:hypothetical protein
MELVTGSQETGTRDLVGKLAGTTMQISASTFNSLEHCLAHDTASGRVLYSESAGADEDTNYRNLPQCKPGSFPTFSAAAMPRPECEHLQIVLTYQA